MDEKIICGLWSAKETLSDHAPLNKQESEAVSYFLDLVLGKLIPSVREFKNCQEAVEHLKKCETQEQRNHFEPKITEYEHKYALIK